MKRLLVVTAVIELGAGLALLCCPSAAVQLLLGTPLDAPAAVVVGRVAGAAILTLAVACWIAHYDPGSRAASGLIGAMLLYNSVAVVVLGFAIHLRPLGLLLWLAVLVHAVMTVWCVMGLQKRTLS